MKPIFIEEFLPKDILNLCYSYLILKSSNEKKFKIEEYTNSLIYFYGNDLMETIMDMSTPVIEQNVGKKLWPTYSYLRIYDRGSDLKIHTDRPSCEYTVALCLGCDPVDKPYELFIGEADENSNYKYFNSNKDLIPLKIEGNYKMKTNNALIFKGMEKLHWREYCQHDHYITVFLHYVDQEGSYKDYKFDKRPMLGYTKD